MQVHCTIQKFGSVKFFVFKKKSVLLKTAFNFQTYNKSNNIAKNECNKKL